MRVTTTIKDPDSDEEHEVEWDVTLFDSVDEGRGAEVEITGPDESDPAWPAIEQVVAAAGGWDKQYDRAVEAADASAADGPEWDDHDD